MAEVNYKASSSRAEQQNEEPSVEILDPKLNSFSVSFSDELETSIRDKSLDLDHPNRPSSTLWRQQKLPAWQPILSPDTVLPAFFLLGIALIPIGVGLLMSSNYVKEKSYEYTDCVSLDGRKCSDIIAKSIRDGVRTKCQCLFNFTLEEDLKAPVFFYYGLSGFYQNHRRYVRSVDDRQLSGKVDQSLNSLCDPYTISSDPEDNNRPIAPCGAIANSLFNDSFTLYLKNSDNNLEPIDLAQTDIAWPTDREVKYNNPPQETWKNYAKPPFWEGRVFDLDKKNADNNGYKNEHLIVWMRTAAFPTFRKLWARIDHDQNILWRTKLPKEYPVINGEWTARKLFHISNTSWLGGKNPFLGYAYIVVGTLCLILWLAFILIVKKFGQHPKDIVDISPKTKFVFTTPKSEDSGDGVTTPLRSGNT